MIFFCNIKHLNWANYRFPVVSSTTYKSRHILQVKLFPKYSDIYLRIFSGCTATSPWVFFSLVMHFLASFRKIPIFRSSGQPATCSIAVTNPFYLSALTRKQMAKRQQLAKKERKKRKTQSEELFYIHERTYIHTYMYVWVDACRWVSGGRGTVVGALIYCRAQLERRPQNETKHWLPCKQATIAPPKKTKMTKTKLGKTNT